MAWVISAMDGKVESIKNGSLCCAYENSEVNVHRVKWGSVEEGGEGVGEEGEGEEEEVGGGRGD